MNVPRQVGTPDLNCKGETEESTEDEVTAGTTRGATRGRSPERVA